MITKLPTTLLSPEEKLKFSELRYRRLFETAQDGILILDADTGKIVDANPFLKDILGYSQSDLLGKELWEIGVFKDIKESKISFRQLQTEGYIRYKDLPLQTKDGRSIDVEFVSNVYLVGHQKVIQCNIRDITDRKIAEEKIRDTQTQLIQAQEIAKIGSWRLDLKTNQVVWSDEMFRISGYAVGEIKVTFEKAMKQIHPDDRVRVQNNLKRAIDEFIPPKFVFQSIDYRIILPNGKERIMYGEATLFSDKNGKPATLVGVVQDITEKNKAKGTVEDNNRRLEKLKKAMLNVMEDLEAARVLIQLEKVKDEAMLACIGEGLIAVDNDKKIIVINKAAEKMLGWARKDLIGKIITILPLEDEQGNAVPIKKRPTHLALSTGETTSVNYFFVRKDKTKFPIAINVTPIKLGKKIIGAVDIFRDITREKEIDRAKSEFVSLASHQLRTPLGIAKWYLEVIKEEGYLDNVPKIAKNYLDEVYKSNERLLSLVRDLLSISRIDQGKVSDVPRSTDIVDLIKNIIKNMNILAAQNKITLHLDLKKQKIPSLFIDPLRAQEIIENLIVNAIIYSEAFGIVHIIVDTKDGKVLIAIKDTGIGISQIDKKKLFTKFFRSEQAAIKNTEGSGLGLYVVKSYVERWGGNISVESSEGKGSTFAVSLPFKMNSDNKRSN